MYKKVENLQKMQVNRRFISTISLKSMVIGHQVFQRTAGIPKGMNRAPLLDKIYLQASTRTLAVAFHLA
jgi:hypothetical protein